MKEIIASVILGLFLSLVFILTIPVDDPIFDATFGAPSQSARLERTILPETDSAWELGTSTKAWLRIFADDLFTLNVTNCTQALETDGNGKIVCGTDATGGAGGGSGTVGTSTNETAGRLAYWTSNSGTPALLGEVATGTLSASSPLSLTGSTVIVGTSRTLSIDTTGTWTGNAGTASALAADPTDCSAGSFPLGINAAGTAQSCTDAWTEAENTAAGYVASTRALTVAGTANQITSSAGSQTLAADRTWTLSLPSHVIFPSSFQVTSATATNATSTNHDITSKLTFGGVTGTTWAEFCESITGGAGLCDGSDATGAGGGASAVATSSQESATYVPFWTSTNGTPAELSGGESTFAYDSTLNKLTVTNASTTQLSVSDVTSALVLTNGSGTLAEYTGIDCTNQFVRDVSALGAGTCATITNADVDLADLTATNTTLTFSGTYDGQTARTIGLNLGNANTWTALQTFSNSSTTLASFDYASSTLWFGGGLLNTCASGSFLTWTGGVFGCDTDDNTTYTAGDALTLTGTDIDFDGGTAPSGELGGTWGAITIDDSVAVSSWNLTTPTLTSFFGAACTNQFLRDIGDTGTYTCATVTSTDVDLADLTATDTSLTFTGAYDGQTARTVGVNLGHNFTWTGAHDLGGATSFELPNGTAPTVNAVGEIAWDTTSGNLVLATSTTGAVVIGSATTTLYAFSGFASTSLEFVSGGIMDMPSHPLQQVATKLWCKADGGTSVQIFLSDGTNDTNTITCTTTGTEFALTSNNTWTSYEAIRFEIGTVSGAVDYLSARVMGYRVTD